MSKARIKKAVTGLLQEPAAPVPQQKFDQQQGYGKANPFPRMVGTVVRMSRFRCAQLEQRRPRQSRLRVALVSMPPIPGVDKTRSGMFQTSLNAGIKGVAPTALKRAIVDLQPGVAKRIEKAYRDALRYALVNEKANIVCFNELALPTFNREPPWELFAHLRQQATKYRALILAGSMHDPRTYLNSGFAFHPKCAEEGDVFHKQVSALAEWERISLPPQRTVAYTYVAGLKVAAMICLDLADYNIVASVIRDRVDLVFVSCYSPGTDLLRPMGEAISECIPGSVYLVNHVSTGLAQSFEVFDGDLKKLESVKSLRSGATVATSSFSIAKIEGRRHDFPDSWHPDWKWLYSTRPAEQAPYERR